MTLTKILLVILLLSSWTNAKKNESWYQKKIAELWNAKTEVRMSDNTRVDIMTTTTAWEVDWANKWSESVGQSLYYSFKSGKKAGIILIVRDRKKDWKHVIKLGAIIKANKLPIELKVYPDDFITDKKHKSPTKKHKSPAKKHNNTK